MTDVPKEKAIQRSISEWLRSVPDVWKVKIVGSPYMPSGIPDFVLCVGGKFLALEVKRPMAGSRLSADQERQLTAIREAGGFSFVVRSRAQAQVAVTWARHAAPGQRTDWTLEASGLDVLGLRGGAG